MVGAVADVSHLLTADEVVNPGLGSTCITLCGEIVRVGRTDVMGVEHCPDCECVPRLCPQCVEAACRWSPES